jgi:hypothetical protein
MKDQGWLLVQIMMAHDIWSKMGSSNFDFDPIFLTPSTAAMFNMLPREEVSLLKVPPTSHPPLT